MDPKRLREIAALAKATRDLVPTTHNPTAEQTKSLFRELGAVAGACMTNLDLRDALKESVPARSLGKLFDAVRYVHEKSKTIAGTDGPAIKENLARISEILEDAAGATSAAKSAITIFYSWQSDLPAGTNRTFIEKALSSAAKSIASNAAVEARVDSDTDGVPGSPDIIHTILKKIESADVVVADVSLIGSAGGRPTPNPNVMFELGYAFRTVGESGVLMVFNDNFGNTRDLPFDLGFKRQITYSAAEGEQDRSAERNRFARKLEEAVRAVVQAKPNTTTLPLTSAMLTEPYVSQGITALEIEPGSILLGMPTKFRIRHSQDNERLTLGPAVLVHSGIRLHIIITSEKNGTWFADSQ